MKGVQVYMSFGEKLKTIRKQRNITQEQLAEMLDVSRQAISKWEADGGYPEIEKLTLLSQKLGVSIDCLLNNEANVVKSQSAICVPSGKIAIMTYDKLNVVMCQAVKCGGRLSDKKGPKYVLWGVVGFNFWGEKAEILGYYKTIDEVQEEIRKINQAIQEGKPSYELQHFAKVEDKGLRGLIIVE